MKIEMLQTLYRILKNSRVNTCEMTRSDLFVKMSVNPAPSSALQEAPVPAAAVVPQAPVPEGLVIKSDTVGVFFSHSTALEKPLVKAGDIVKKGQTIGHIVSMGISHNLVAGVDGRVVNQRVRHKEPVEYGEVIFELERE